MDFPLTNLLSINSNKIVFAIFLSFYLEVLLGNLLTIATIKTSLLFYLSSSDDFLSTCVASRMIVDVLTKKTTTSFSECTVQVFPFHFLGCLEILILILTVTDFGVLVAVAWDGSFVHD